jgi:hypothetical protein
MTQQEWLAEGKRRFGTDLNDWRFQCVSCREVYSGADFAARGVDAAKAAQGCIGRVAGGREAINLFGFHKSRPTAPGGRGCDYAAFGLIPLPGLVAVEMPDGTGPILAMPFAEAT